MLDVFGVKASKKVKLVGQGGMTICYLTLGYINSQSDNRYIISLSGKEAAIDWHEGDRLMLNLSLCAYKTQDQWHLNTCDDSLKLLEIQVNKQ